MMKQICFSFLFLACAACSHKMTMGPNEYSQFIRSGNNGLSVSQEINAIKYRLKLLPPDYLALNSPDFPMQSSADKPGFFKEFDDKMEFIFVIEDPDRNSQRVKSTVFDKARYSSILSYANSELRNDFMLMTERDTLYCSLAHLEAANSVQPLLRLVIGFQSIHPLDKEFTLVYDDHIFNNGPVKFHYPKRVMEGLPELNL